MADVVVVGGTGIVGAAAVSALAPRHHVVATHCSRPGSGTVRFDLGDALNAELDRALEGCRALIVAGGVTSLAACAIDRAGSRRINVEGVARLAARAAERGARAIYLSSDAVFSTPAGAPPPDEDAEPAPATEYGRQKLDAERALPEGSLVLRLTKIADGFVDAIAATLRAGQAVRAASDQRLSLLAATEVGEVLARAIDAGLGGVFHLAAPPARSRFEWCRRVADAVGASADLVEPCSIAEFDDDARGERMAREATLDGSRLIAALDLDLSTGDDALLSRCGA